MRIALKRHQNCTSSGLKELCRKCPCIFIPTVLPQF